MTDKLIRTGIVAAALVAIVFMVYLTLQETKVAFASAPSGLPATFATSSVDSLAANTATVIAATSTCAARIITTAGASSVVLLFTDKFGNTLTGNTFTALQAASTTVSYDSGIYGCGLVRALAYAAQLVNITETQ